MATLTVGVSGSGIVGNASRNFTVSDADLQKLFDWAVKFVPEMPSSPTNLQILNTWAKWLMDGTTKTVKQQQQIPDATAAAVAAVVPIAIT